MQYYKWGKKAVWDLTSVVKIENSPNFEDLEVAICYKK